jgi:hypothetical protein
MLPVRYKLGFILEKMAFFIITAAKTSKPPYEERNFYGHEAVIYR